MPRACTARVPFFIRSLLCMRRNEPLWVRVFEHGMLQLLCTVLQQHSVIGPFYVANGGCNSTNERLKLWKWDVHQNSGEKCVLVPAVDHDMMGRSLRIRLQSRCFKKRNRAGGWNQLKSRGVTLRRMIIYLRLNVSKSNAYARIPKTIKKQIPVLLYILLQLYCVTVDSM